MQELRKDAVNHRDFDVAKPGYVEKIKESLLPFYGGNINEAQRSFVYYLFIYFPEITFEDLDFFYTSTDLNDADDNEAFYQECSDFYFKVYDNLSEYLELLNFVAKVTNQLNFSLESGPNSFIFNQVIINDQISSVKKAISEPKGKDRIVAPPPKVVENPLVSNNVPDTGEFAFELFYASLVAKLTPAALKVFHEVLKLSQPEKAELQKSLLYGRVSTLPAFTEADLNKCKACPQAARRSADSYPDPMEDTPVTRFLSAPQLTTLRDPIMENSRITFCPGVVSIVPNKRDIVAGYNNQLCVYNAIKEQITDKASAAHLRVMMVGANFPRFDPAFIKYRYKRTGATGLDGKHKKKGVLLGLYGDMSVVKFGQYADAGHLTALTDNLKFETALTQWAPSPLGVMVGVAKTDKGRRRLDDVAAEIKALVPSVEVSRVLNFLNTSKSLEAGVLLPADYPVYTKAAFNKKIGCSSSFVRLMAGDRAVTEVVTSYLVMAPFLLQLIISLDGCKGDGWRFVGAHQLSDSKDHGTYFSDSRGLPNLPGHGEMFSYRSGVNDPVSDYIPSTTHDSEGLPVLRCIPAVVYSKFESSRAAAEVNLLWEHDQFVLRKDNTSVDLKSKHLGQVFAVTHVNVQYRGPVLSFTDDKGKLHPTYKLVVVVVPVNAIEELAASLGLYHIRVLLGSFQMIHSVVLILEAEFKPNVIDFKRFAGQLRSFLITKLLLYGDLHEGLLSEAQPILDWQREYITNSDFVSSRISDLRSFDLNEMFKPSMDKETTASVKINVNKMNFANGLDILRSSNSDDSAHVASSSSSSNVPPQSFPNPQHVSFAPLPGQGGQPSFQNDQGRGRGSGRNKRQGKGSPDGQQTNFNAGVREPGQFQAGRGNDLNAVQHNRNDYSKNYNNNNNNRNNYPRKYDNNRQK